MEFTLSVPEHSVHYLEIVTPDVASARQLYEATSGWSFEDPVPELGNAVVATLPDGSLCGIRAPMAEHEAPIVRTYLRVLDIDAVVDQAAASGAEIALAPTELPGHGRIAIYLHGGIQQGLWQLP